jgi:hypothetical protein
MPQPTTLPRAAIYIHVKTKPMTVEIELKQTRQNYIWNSFPRARKSMIFMKSVYFNYSIYSKCNSPLSTANFEDLNMLLKQACKSFIQLHDFRYFLYDMTAINIGVTKQRTVCIQHFLRGTQSLSHSVTQSLQKFTGHYGNGNFTRARHCSQTLRQVYTLSVSAGADSEQG